jgi:hypothetical protein
MRRSGPPDVEELRINRILGSALHHPDFVVRVDISSSLATNLVPIETPWAPRLSAATSPLPSAIPPEAMTGIGLT